MAVSAFYELMGKRNKTNNDGNLFGDILNIFKKKETPEDNRSEIQKITGLTYEDLMKMQRDRENQLMNKQALIGGISDAGKYAYLGGKAYQDAAKNIGVNTQDMLRSMAYGQAALSKSIAGASNLTPLNRKYFS